MDKIQNTKSSDIFIVSYRKANVANRWCETNNHHFKHTYKIPTSIAPPQHHVPLPKIIGV
jgi:hypothetical protein